MTPSISISNHFVRNWLVVVVVLGSTAAVASSFGGFPSRPENGQALSASGMNQNFDALQHFLDQLDERLVVVESATVSSVPPGTIVAFGGETVPEGWLLCDGAVRSRTEDSALFAAIGVAHGGGDGVNTFNLPDLRGRFLRGVDHGAGIDPDAAARVRPHDASGNLGDAVGSVQSSMFTKHWHHVGQTLQNIPATGGCGAPVGTPYYGCTLETDTTGAGGSETRPVNSYVEYIIKY